MGHVARTELNGGIALPHWLELVKTLKAIQVEIVQTDLPIELQTGLQQLR